MSAQWLWRSGDEVRGPLSAAELAAILRSRANGDADEVRPVGASDWTPAADVAQAFGHGADSSHAAADAAAALLLMAAELRLSGAFDPNVEETARNSPETGHTPHPESASWVSMLARGAWSPRRLLVIAAAAATILAVWWQAATPPDNAAVYAELIRLHASISDRGASSGQSRPEDARSVEKIIATLKSAASRTPILSLGARPAETSAVLARRDLLSAARDLQQMLRQSAASPVLDADFQRHMKSAADRLSVGHRVEGSGR